MPCKNGDREYQEGMKGSKITIDDFSEKKNSMFSADCQDKLIETLEKLNMTLESFNNKTHSEKGGEKVMNKFEELLAKYGKTAEEVTFEYENLSDEELEVAFKEAFEGDDGDDATIPEGDDTDEGAVIDDVDDSDGEDDENGGNDGDDEEPNEDSDEPAEELEEEAGSESEDNFVLKYELSHEDVRTALYSLLAVESDAEYCYAWILEVFDDKFIYQDYMENKFYRRGYSKGEDNVSLDENKVEVFNEWLSQSEKDALEALKSDYAALKAFKETYDASVIMAQKTEILDKAEYECLANNTEFAQLRAEMDKFSVEEISTKADLIFAAHIKTLGEFSAKTKEEKKPNMLQFNVNKTENKKKKAYGNLFPDTDKK